jgi:thiamine transporter ThiT
MGSQKQCPLSKVLGRIAAAPQNSNYIAGFLYWTNTAPDGLTAIRYQATNLKAARSTNLCK